MQFWDPQIRNDGNVLECIHVRAMKLEKGWKEHPGVCSGFAQFGENEAESELELPEEPKWRGTS